MQNHTTYISRDVIFVEDIFPYANTVKKNSDATTSTSVTVPLLNCATSTDAEYLSPVIVDLVPASAAHVDHQHPSVNTPRVPIQQPLRRTARIPRPPQTLSDYVCNTLVHTKTEYHIHKYVDYSQSSSLLQKYALQVLTDVEPTCYTKACKDQKWMDAMHKELDALQATNTWEITDLPPRKNPVSSKWVYRIKRKLDGFH
ncbi:unnamed protein product [Rhodiola kirilowii]